MRRRIAAHRPSGVIIAVLLSVGVAGGPVHAAPATSTPTPAASATPTPAASATSTPVATSTATRTATPTADPRYPPLEATVIATASFDCERVTQTRACPTDIDDRQLSFSASFTGAVVVGSSAYADMGHAAWDVVLPGTSTRGPGGSVAARLTAGPGDLFRALRIDCIRPFTFLDPEPVIPATRDGNTVSFEFEVPPEASAPTYAECRFVFDAAAAPRVPMDPGAPPATDSLVRHGDGPLTDGRAAVVISLLLGATAFGVGLRSMARRRHP